MLPSSHPANLPLPDRDYCLFLDFDGTLVDLAPRPEEVARDAALVALLGETSGRLQGALAVVSGRQIDAIDALLAPLRIPVAGVHGYERRSAAGVLYRPTPDAVRLAALREKLTEFVAEHPGLLLEDKSVALAVHYRMAPFLAPRVVEYVQGLSVICGDELEVQEGNSVLEIKPATHDKAVAVEAFLQEPPFAGRTPIFIGDDITDSDGFAAVERHAGIAIAVGTRVSTPWRLQDPAAVRAWLADFNRMSVRAREY
jgi:trehalose 6-phosphate phosphatase